MKFALIICTYKRPKALETLLNSVEEQSLHPNDFIIVDGSFDDDTGTMLQNKTYKNLRYFKVSEKDRGLTRQRNFGISKLRNDTEVVCFLDDDIVLYPDYFKNLIKTYETHPDALSVGGYIANEINWQNSDKKNSSNTFYFDGFEREESLRFKARKWFGLQPDVPPGFMPSFSHGRSVGFLPPSGRTYEVEQFMGGVSSYKKEIFDRLKFSPYFEGYGLYEDADFCLRLAKQGKLYVNTSAQLEHHHEPAGRPNHFKYGKMVVRNGWYVWRVKYPKPTLKARLKWNATSLLLTLIRFSNVLTEQDKTGAFMEAVGRTYGWFSLVLSRPKTNL